MVTYAGQKLADGKSLTSSIAGLDDRSITFPPSPFVRPKRPFDVQNPDIPRAIRGELARGGQLEGGAERDGTPKDRFAQQSIKADLDLGTDL